MANGRKLIIQKEKDSNGEIIFTYKTPIKKSAKTQVHVSKKNYKKSKVHSIIQEIFKKWNIDSVHIPFHTLPNSKNTTLRRRDLLTSNNKKIDKLNETSRRATTDIMTLTEEQILELMNDATLTSPFAESTNALAENVAYKNMIHKIFGANRSNLAKTDRTHNSYEFNFRRKNTIIHNDVQNGRLARALFFLSIKVEMAKEMKIGNKALKRKHYNVFKMGPL
tara:strand:+ start:680 stop:1345 length:666 start_codon:yes stop_codon:yes gene_type:complete